MKLITLIPISRIKCFISNLVRKNTHKEIITILETVHDAITSGVILGDDRGKGNSIKLAIQNHLIEHCNQ